MEIQTMSIVVGGSHCNAQCPYCISKQTGLDEVRGQCLPNCYRNGAIALHHAKIGNVTTLLLTGKGEPTLYPEAITAWLEAIARWEDKSLHLFPYKELQTNGIAIGNGSISDELLKKWHSLGLTTISISVAHYDYLFNQNIFTPGKKYIDLTVLIRRLSDMGFTVRINCTLLKDGINSLIKVHTFINEFQYARATQFTFRPVKAIEGENLEVVEWTNKNLPDEKFLIKLRDYFNLSPKILTLAHGPTVHDYAGVAVCLSDCLTRAPEDSKSLRQLILYGDGRLTYDWQYKGAQLLPPECK